MELEVTRGEQERLEAFAERAKAQRKLSEAIEEKRFAKETRAKEVTLRIAQEIEERDKKGVEAFEIFAEEARGAREGARPHRSGSRLLLTRNGPPRPRGSTCARRGMRKTPPTNSWTWSASSSRSGRTTGGGPCPSRNTAP